MINPKFTKYYNTKRIIRGFMMNEIKKELMPLFEMKSFI